MPKNAEGLPWYYGAAVAVVAVYLGLSMSGLASWLHGLLDVRYSALAPMHVAAIGSVRYSAFS